MKKHISLLDIMKEKKKWLAFRNIFNGKTLHKEKRKCSYVVTQEGYSRALAIFDKLFYLDDEKKERNDSLDIVSFIGRLYFDVPWWFGFILEEEAESKFKKFSRYSKRYLMVYSPKPGFLKLKLKYKPKKYLQGSSIILNSDSFVLDREAFESFDIFEDFIKEKVKNLLEVNNLPFYPNTIPRFINTNDDYPPQKILDYNLWIRCQYGSPGTTCTVQYYNSPGYTHKDPIFGTSSKQKNSYKQNGEFSRSSDGKLYQRSW